MANEKRRLIDANELMSNIHFYDEQQKNDVWRTSDIEALLAEQPTVSAVEVPCKIGDFVWAIRSFKGKKHPQRGVVSDMFFARDMKLMIVVKYVARGEWGKTVFATDKEANAAICAKMEGDGNV